MAAVHTSTAAVAVRGLTHEYRADAGRFVALRDVDIEIRDGQFVALVGPSGCGKSTLLRIVAGLLEPTAGEVCVRGTNVEAARGERGVGLVTQDPGLLPWRTVAQNVALALEVTGVQADVAALLTRVGIAQFAAYHPNELSGGMRQRVALARALAHGPELLLMDEPFGSLDEFSREAMGMELLRIWERDRISALFVTHSIREAVMLADRVLVMSAAPGGIVADVEISLPRPRSRELEDTAEFASHMAAVRAFLGRR